MDFTVNKISDDVYEIVFEDNRFEITTEDLEHLHAQLSAILRPETVAEKQSRHKELLENLIRANDSGIQSLLHLADHDDVVILLETAEQDEELKKKLQSIYGNTYYENVVSKLNKKELFQLVENISNGIPTSPSMFEILDLSIKTTHFNEDVRNYKNKQL